MQTNNQGYPRTGSNRNPKETQDHYGLKNKINNWRVIISLILINLCIAGFSGNAQNLVPNPGFETAATCPSNNAFTAANWYNPNTASPDYFHPCGTGWTIPGTGVLFGPQMPRTGSAFAAVGWYGLGGGWYEYIQVQLTAPMIAGEVYTVSMWVNLPDGAKKAGDDLGIYISNNRFKSTSTIQSTIPTIIPTTPTNFGVFTTLSPQIKCVDGNFITDVTNWTLVSGTYLAAGGEQVITIGCFEPWTTTGTLIVNPTGNDRCYYYVDDVSVRKLTPLPVELISFDAIADQNKRVNLSWKTASEVNTCTYEVEKSINTHDFQKIGVLKAGGTNNTLTTYHYTDWELVDGLAYYRLKTVDCNGVISYSEIVSAKTIPLIAEVFPNPVEDELTIVFAKGNAPTTIFLYDMMGDEIFHTDVSQEKILIPFSEHTKGVYTLIIHSEDREPIYQKIIKN